MFFKRFLLGILLVALLIGPLGLGVRNAYALQPDPDEVVTFAMLGQEEITLKGPAGSGGIDLVLPADWEILDGSELHLTMHVYSGQSGTNLPGSTAPVAGFLTIRLNNVWVQTITLDHEGDYTFVVPFPSPQTWITEPRNSIQSLRFYLEDAQTCEMIEVALLNGVMTGISIVIQPTSYLVLPHRSAPIPLDLRMFPYPIYQETFLPEKAVLVMPSQPTEQELQAVFTVAGAMGKLTRGKFLMTYTTADLLDPAALDESQAIFVGKPSSFPQLNGVSLPASFTGTSFNDPQISPDDGVLQIFVSPRNPLRTWLLVSGSTDEAVVKAAQALSSGAIRPGSRTDLAIVSDVQPIPRQVDSYSITLKDLGYQSLAFDGYGQRYATYWVNIPLDYTVSEGAYFEMTFVNSAMLNYEESGLSVSLNDTFVGGIRYSDRTTTVTTFRFSIPAYLFRPGENLLRIQSSQHARTPCVSYSDIWFSISSGSQLYIPLAPARQEPMKYDFGDYPVPLFALFDQTAIIVAREDPAGWSAAASIVYDLGTTPRGSIINPVMFYGDSVPENIRRNYDLLIVGRASTLPIVGDLGFAMPAPFPTGQDVAIDPNAEVSFKIPTTSSIGYVETFTSPWNNRRGVLIVAGTNSAGVQAAAAALIAPLVRKQFEGNFAIISDTQIISSTIEVQQQDAAAVATPTPQVQVQTSTEKQPFNVNFIVIGSIVIGLLVVLGIVYWFVARKRGKNKPDNGDGAA